MRFVLAAIILCGCGARSGLDVATTANAASSDAGSSGDRSPVADVAAPPEASVSCAAPEPVVLATFPTGASGIALAQDDLYLYWGQTHEGNLHTNVHDIVRVSKCGGPVETVATNVGYAYAIDADDTYVYAATGSLVRAPKTGGDATTLYAPQSGSGGHVLSMARNGATLYFDLAPSNATGSYEDEIHAISVTGADDRILGVGYQGVTVDDTWVYTISDRTGEPRLYAIAHDGGDALDVAAFAAPWEPITANDVVYFVLTDVMTGTNTIASVTVGGPAKQFAVVGQGPVDGLATDPSFVYSSQATTDWSNEKSGRILQWPKKGGVATVLATLQDQPEAVLVDATSVYWLDFGGQVMKRDKP
jgi:hypothetical protein